MARWSAFADAAALTVFAVVGVLTHGSSVGALGRDLLLFSAAGFAVALVLKLYSRGGRKRLLATWLIGISAAVLIRAALVGNFAATSTASRSRSHCSSCLRRESRATWSKRCASRRLRAAARDLLGRRADVVQTRQLRQALETEDALEERRRAVLDRAARAASSRPDSVISPRSTRFATAESAATPRMRAISGREHGPRYATIANVSSEACDRFRCAGFRRAAHTPPPPRAPSGMPSRLRHARARSHSALGVPLAHEPERRLDPFGVVVCSLRELLDGQRRRATTHRAPRACGRAGRADSVRSGGADCP